MGEVRAQHPPTLPLVAVITKYLEALEWARERCAEHWGAPLLESPTFTFNETSYYDATMGAGLGKTFLAFGCEYDPGELASIKHLTNAWEAEYAALGRHPEPRPLNLDPGYLTAAKLVLASTKDHAHRIYLGHGMFAEITLFYRHGTWQSHEFTFPDYRRADFHAFFQTCRERLKGRG
ncbi:MAG: DUF4416 domain-containing protein [Pirellula sp.]|nr:DUF4416 domain-containing protein [Pirellula sp.]